MPIKTVVWPVIILGIVVLLNAGTARADCQAESPTGHFEGTAKSPQAGDLTVTLDLRCSSGQYQGEIVTPAGTFAITGGSFEAGVLHLQFDTGGDVGTIEARFDAGIFRGTFRVADGTGPIERRRTGDPKALTPVQSALNLTKDQWRQDLKYFASELPKRHANAFHSTSRERFEAEVAKLNQQIDRLDPDGIYVGLDIIANLIGDGHTYVEFPADTADFPLIIRQFGADYRVTGVAPGLERALGARVLKVQNIPMTRARELIFALTPQDETPALAQARIDNFLTLGIVLHGLGITPDRNTASYTLGDDNGTVFTIEVHALPPGERSHVKWVSVVKEPPLYRQKPAENFWYTYLSDSRTVYCSFRTYKDLGKYAGGLLKLVNQQHPDKLILDLRQNGGGDYTEGLKHLIHPIRDLPDINRKGHLFVIIGVSTFSAAMSNAAQFRSQTAAILVGQPIGEKPNSYQEPRQMTLPNSHLIVRYSTRFYKFVESGENIVRPDQEIVTSWSDFKAGTDPVLEWILKYP